MIIGIQGIEGSFSEEAAKSFFLLPERYKMFDFDFAAILDIFDVPKVIFRRIHHTALQ